MRPSDASASLPTSCSWQNSTCSLPTSSHESRHANPSVPSRLRSLQSGAIMLRSHTLMPSRCLRCFATYSLGIGCRLSFVGLLAGLGCVAVDSCDSAAWPPSWHSLFSNSVRGSVALARRNSANEQRKRSQQSTSKRKRRSVRLSIVDDQDSSSGSDWEGGDSPKGPSPGPLVKLHAKQWEKTKFLSNVLGQTKPHPRLITHKIHSQCERHHELVVPKPIEFVFPFTLTRFVTTEVTA